MSQFSKFNPGVVITPMEPSKRLAKRAHRNAQRLSGKLSLAQVRAIKGVKTPKQEK